jgi:hypothetical protein
MLDGITMLIHTSQFLILRQLNYAIGIAPMSSKNEWMNIEIGLKRPADRPRKNRIKSSDGPKKISHKCTRCGMYGHHRSTYKNPVMSHDSENIIVQVRRDSKTKKFNLYIFFVMLVIFFVNYNSYLFDKLL